MSKAVFFSLANVKRTLKVDRKNVLVKDVGGTRLEGEGRVGPPLGRVAPQQRKRASNVTPEKAGGQKLACRTVKMHKLQNITTGQSLFVIHLC